MPLPAGPSHRHDERGDCKTTLVYLVASDAANNLRSVTMTEYGVEVGEPTVVSCEDYLPALAHLNRAAPVETPPLCDAARFERTGVLLI